MPNIAITLDQQAIQEALVKYVETLGISLANSHVTVNLTAGRGANGHSAEIALSRKGDNEEQKITSTAKAEPEDKAPRKKPGRPSKADKEKAEAAKEEKAEEVEHKAEPIKEEDLPEPEGDAADTVEAPLEDEDDSSPDAGEADVANAPAKKSLF